MSHTRGCGCWEWIGDECVRRGIGRRFARMNADYTDKYAPSVVALLANVGWLALSLPDALRWHRAAGDVAAAQKATLFRILRANANIQYPLPNAPASIRSVADFQRAFPLVSYDDLAPWVERIGRGESGVLTAEAVRLLEPTSGSTAATKLIPYTDSLKAEFRRGIGPWVVRAFLGQPGLLAGPAWWSVTPVAERERRAPGGIPIGFEEESEYFGRGQSRLIRALMAVPGAVKLISDPDSFRYVTLLFLLRTPALRLISVWNPTFPMLVLAPLADQWPRLVEDIGQGTLTPPAALPADLHSHLSGLNRPQPRQAEAIAAACRAAVWESDADRGALHRRLWPRLGLVSCWADGNAAGYAARLARLLPQARLQPKGLLSTEGFVSFPLDGHPGHALSLGSHFFEFLPVQNEAAPDGMHVRLAHQLEEGGSYEVVITTGGGLYRYRLGDVVDVVGHSRGCPLLRFVGRAHAVCDWFGEKLNERHVADVLAAALARRGWEPHFAMLACHADAPRPGYFLFLEQPGVEHGALTELTNEIETGLMENVHYAYCRRLGQLQPLGLCPVERGLERYIAACVARGQRAGDVKPVALHRWGGWREVFAR